MYKKLFLICVFVAVALTSTQFATADYTLTNRTTETVWVVYATWQPWQPEGWRTWGWYEIKPNATESLETSQDGEQVYIYVEGDESGEIKPSDRATRESTSFLIHPWKPFSVLQTAGGNFIKSNRAQWSLERAEFYKYRNGGSHTIVEQRLPDLPAQQIYNQAINSVVWIHTGISLGSGVLIDKARKLIVTNQHVTDNAEWVDVFFPYKQNGSVNKNTNFYVRNKEWLETRGYATQGRVIAQNRRNDLAIVQLVQIPTTAHEIKHDFSRNVENSMRQGDTIHILGNPGERLWNWTRGTFQRPYQVCDFADGTSLVGCLQMEADTHGGNSGGPVLNGQGTLIGLLVAGTDETESLAAPTRNIKALLNTVPVNLGAISPPRQTYPKRVFRIRNNTGVTVPYQIRWSNSDEWQAESLETGFISTHWSVGQNIPSGYPKIQFDYIAGDQAVTYRRYNLDTALFREGNNNHAPTYFFRYNQRGDMLNLLRDAAAAPSLSKAAPEETVLLSNYPNPFNPETWIPYKLAKPAEVTVTIYAADGKLVQTLALGHQAAGVYQSKSRAVYWDGRNALGEPVASGLYFYTLKAGEFTATRKMLIRK